MACVKFDSQTVKLLFSIPSSHNSETQVELAKRRVVCDEIFWICIACSTIIYIICTTLNNLHGENNQDESRNAYIKTLFHHQRPSRSVCSSLGMNKSCALSINSLRLTLGACVLLFHDVGYLSTRCLPTQSKSISIAPPLGLGKTFWARRSPNTKSCP